MVVCAVAIYPIETSSEEDIESGDPGNGAVQIDPEDLCSDATYRQDASMG